MSRHHMLPPIAYTPPPPPKKISKRRPRIDVSEGEDIEELSESSQTTGAGRSTATAKKPAPTYPEIEGADRKPKNPQGRLSENTLTVMLQAQELK
jgi:hypothetical protein